MGGGSLGAWGFGELVPGGALGQGRADAQVEVADGPEGALGRAAVQAEALARRQGLARLDERVLAELLGLGQLPVHGPLDRGVRAHVPGDDRALDPPLQPGAEVLAAPVQLPDELPQRLHLVDRILEEAVGVGDVAVLGLSGREPVVLGWRTL